MSMRVSCLTRRAAFVWFAGILAHSVAMAQTAVPAKDGQPALPPPSASDGGKVELLPARPIADSADPITQAVAAQTVDGLVLLITIDGATVTLDSAVPARVPRRQARSARVAGGDVVKATAFTGGQALSTTVVPDTVLNASEGGGLVRTERRQISLMLAADRAIEYVTVQALATGASATLDVRPAYARICETDRNSKWCPRRNP